MQLSQFRFPAINKVTIAQLQLALGITKEGVFPQKRPAHMGFLDKGFYFDLEHTYDLYVGYTEKRLRVVDSKLPMSSAVVMSDGSSRYLINLGCLGDLCLECCLKLDQESVTAIVSTKNQTDAEEPEIFKLPFYFKRVVGRHRGESLESPTLIVDTTKLEAADIEELCVSSSNLTEFSWVEEEFRHVLLQEVKPMLQKWYELLLKTYPPEKASEPESRDQREGEEI